MRHMSQKLMFSCGLLLMSFAAMGAAADAGVSVPEVSTYRVNYADLNLDHRAGADALFARIRSAARRVCEPVGGSLWFQFTQLQEKSCSDKALADAVFSVGSPLLTEIYLGKASTIKIAQK